MKKPLNHKDNLPNTPPARSRRDEQGIRAAACAAFHIFSAARRHNADRPENYVISVCHLLYAILRAGFPRVLPVPKSWNRSSISEAEKRFDDRFTKELDQIERQTTAKRRPSQPRVVTRALAMLPRARSGGGPCRAEPIFTNLRSDFQPIHRLMSIGIELALLRQRFNRKSTPKR